MDLQKRHASFGGWVEVYSHVSSSTSTPMRFAIYLPPQAASGKCPVVYVLSGLTCTEDNFTSKAGAQRYAAEHGVILVMPDTSPRGAGVPGEDASWDFGTGAGFYVNATEAGWAHHYRMFDYVRDELPHIVERRFPVAPGRRGVMGHSMGGHGALILALRFPDRYLSVSAFAPICAPSDCPWGQKAFTGYLGADPAAWSEYDATRLVARERAQDHKRLLLIDQGTDDEFLAAQLKPELLQRACAAADHPIDVRLRSGYDHSYHFIATFVGEHLEHHARILKA